MAEEYAVKRRFSRIPSQNAILVKKVGNADRDGFAKTQIMGQGGCMFVSAVAWGVGSVVEMLLSVRGTLAKIWARVVYERPREDLCYEVGVEFVEIPSPDRDVLERLFPPREGNA